MDKFLSHRFEVVERLECRTRELKSSHLDQRNGTKPREYHPDNPNYNCKFCHSKHALKHCSQFLNLDPQARNKFVSNNKLSLNCLSYNHLRKDCPSKFSCSHCKMNHHSLLHFSNPSGSNTVPSDRSNARPHSSTTIREGNTARTSSNVTQTEDTNSSENTLLPTALVKILHRKEYFGARAFLDQGSEKTFISKGLQRRLMLPIEPRPFQIYGMGGKIIAQSSAVCRFTLFSEVSKQHIPVTAIVVPKITRVLPSFEPLRTSIPPSIFEDIRLADPKFYLPSHVDLLIGSNILPQILLEGVRQISPTLIAQNSIFRWFMSGPIKGEAVSTFSIGAQEISSDHIGDQLKRFWEQEEILENRPVSKED